MIRGLIVGSLFGFVVGGTGLTIASLVSEQPAGNTPPSAPQVSVPQTTAKIDAPTYQALQDVAPTLTTPYLDSVVKPIILTQDNKTALPWVDITSAEIPQASDIFDSVMTPRGPFALSVDATTVDPVLPSPQSIAPRIPISEQDLAILTTPAALPKMVEVVEQDSVKIIILDIAVPQPRPTDAVVIAMPELGTSLPTGGKSVPVNRMTGQDDVVLDHAVVPTIDSGTPALVRYATAFENVEDKPLIGIILIDDGSMKGASAAVQSLPFDVTIILDPSLDGAVDQLTMYRAAGVEVGVQAALPVNTTLNDVEITLERLFARMSETVLLLNLGVNELQNDLTFTKHLMEGLTDRGRGLVMVPKGLNMALQAAAQVDVPVGVIFRDLDSKGQDSRVISRFLDQATFHARQNSGVLLLARVRPNTISALKLWGSANRTAQVAIAPASAVLLAGN